MESRKSITVLRQTPDDQSAVEIEASARLERRQLDMLLMHALKISGGDFSHLVSAAGKGAYAEQFVQLDAAAVRTASGDFNVGLEPLNSHRADPSTQSVMRSRKIVHGPVTAHGMPLHFSSGCLPVTHFVQIPIKTGVKKTSVLLVANPGISTSGKLQGDMLSRLLELAEAISKRQQRHLAISQQRPLSPSSDESAFKLGRLKEELDHAVVTVSTTGVIRGINPSAEKMFGFDARQALGMTLDRYLPPKYFISTLQQVESWNIDRNDEAMIAMNHRNVSILAEDGLTKQLSAAAYYIRDNNEKCVSFVLSEPKSGNSVEDESGGLNFRINSLSWGVLRLDADCRCEDVNDLWCQISGQGTLEAKGLGWTEAIHTEDLMDIWLELGSIAENRRPYSGKVRLNRLDGSVRQVALAASCVPDIAGRANGFTIVFQDLTANYSAQQHINYAAEHDALTGLANRSAFLDSLQLRLNNRHLRSKTALLYINIKGLKAVNADIGQHAGDEILRQLSMRLISCVSNPALGARLSGSEFSLMLMQTIDPIEICSAGELIVKCIREPYLVFGDALQLSATVGISIGDENSNSSDQLLKQADVALSAATLSKHSDWKVYSRKLDNKGVKEIRLNEGLRAAVANNDFTLDYQPQYSLEKDEIISFEALLRWMPLDMPVPDTEQLIQKLESMGLIAKVGSWILETACHQFTIWQDIGLLAKGCTMSVNIALAQLMNSEFPEQVATILSDNRMLPNQLNLEITESTLNENNVVAYHVIDGLKNMGVRLSLSAFGTGEASLSHLNRLPIDFLKIDRSFVMAMDTHEPSRSMVMSVLAMANTLDIDVVADGIDSSDTLGKLRAAQCKFVQGNLISTAKSAAFLEPMLVRRNYKSEDMLRLS
ncbi:MAG: diguanylate cyclase (GGDEF)-like protein/PAS domain S-box-containing protein [Granulosicoccus sp.]